MPLVLPLMWFMMKNLSRGDPAVRKFYRESVLLLLADPRFFSGPCCDLSHFLFFDLVEDSAFSGALWPDKPTLRNFGTIVREEHFYLHHFWVQIWNSLWIAVAVGALTLATATCAAFAISRLKVKGGRTVMNLALFTYFIPAAFLAIRCTRRWAYGLLNSRWSLVLAMVTLAAPYAIWVLKQASDKLPYELDEAARIDGRHPAAAVPPGVPALDDPLARGDRHLCAAARVDEYLYLPPALARKRTITLAVALGHFISADDSPWELLMATGLVYALPPAAIYYGVPALHGRRPHRRRGESLMASVPFVN